MPAPGAIAIAVSDMARSVAFYELLDLRFRSDHPQHYHCVDTPFPFMLNEDPLLVMMGIKDEMPANGRASLLINCASPAEVDRLYERAAAQGHGFTAPWDAFWGQHYAILRDPDGTRVDLYYVITPE